MFCFSNIHNHFVKEITKLKFFLLILFLSFTLNSSAQLVPDFRVNDDAGSTFQGRGKLGIDDQGNFIVVWKDGRLNYSSQDVYCQIFNSNALRIGNNFKINSSQGINGLYPKIAVRENGSFVVCWNDTLVRLRIFNSNGVPISSEIIVNNTQHLGAGGSKHSIACDTSGNFIVVWEKPIPYTGPNINIHYQRFDSIGNKIGTDIKVNEDTAKNMHTNPVITIRKDGSFIVTWETYFLPVGGGIQSIYMQMFDKNGLKIGNNIKVYNKIDTMDQQIKPLISSDDSGRFCIAFSNYDFSSGDYDALFQLYNSNGTPNGGPIYIDVSGYDEAVASLYKRKNGDIIVGYQKEISLGYFPYFQRINSNGTPIGIPYRLSNLISGIKGYEDVAIFNDRIISIWYDERNGYDGDIYCNIRSFSNPDSIINNINNISNEKPEEIKLFQNYPNPFNSITKIKYAIKNSVYNIQYSEVSIIIYDLLGREVISLVNKKQSPGIYEIVFVGINISTGIYFYSLFLDGKRIETKKLVILK